MTPRISNFYKVRPSVYLLFISILIVVVATIDAQISFSKMVEMTDARARARTTRLNLEHVLSLFKDLETGSRGYVITGLPEYLEPYNHAKDQLPAAYLQLKTQYPNAQLPEGVSWKDVDELVSHRYELSKQVVNKRKELGVDVIQDVELFNEGKKTMDDIRSYFAKLDALQGARIHQLNDAVHRLRNQAQNFAWISTFITALMMGLALYLLNRERKMRVQLEGELRESNQSLELKVLDRTKDLTEAKARIAEFALEQESAIEGERRRLAREVHDQIGQIFTGIKLIVSSVQEQHFPPGQYKTLQDSLETGVKSTRRITAELRPPLLDDLGLEAALDFLVGQYAANAGYMYEVELNNAQKLTEPQTLALFRITQEAISNIIKYAHAKHVVIKDAVVQDYYEYVISDDGEGFKSESTRPGALGLISMRERASLFGGQCIVESKQAEGTTITIHLPLTMEAQT